jgi:pyruvate/2-oxoglutarate dehydrogenase complex dihydrolipoamide dehydrogenase (E3) component
VIATGSRPRVPKIPGLAEAGYLTNVTVWDLNERPETLVVLGAGPVGVEFAQAFARLGSKVKVLTETRHILPREDPEVSDRVEALLAAEGLIIKTGVEITRVFVRDGQKVLACKDQATKDTFETAGSHILVATGRLANIDGLNLHHIGIHADPHEGIAVDEYLQTRFQRVYAIGDVLARHEFTHAAEREAAVAFQNAVLRLPKKIDYSALPWATFIEPEVATVGLSEAAAREQHTEVRVFRAEFADLDRARIDGQTEGFAKVVATPAGMILGVTIVGAAAAMILQEFVLAMEHGLRLGDIASTVHPYPTYAGLAHKLANQFVATRLERGFVQTALRWLYGYQPRTGANGGATEPQASEPAEPADHAHADQH